MSQGCPLAPEESSEGALNRGSFTGSPCHTSEEALPSNILYIRLPGPGTQQQVTPIVRCFPSLDLMYLLDCDNNEHSCCGVTQTQWIVLHVDYYRRTPQRGEVFQASTPQMAMWSYKKKPRKSAPGRAFHHEDLGAKDIVTARALPSGTQRKIGEGSASCTSYLECRWRCCQVDV